MDLKAKTPEEFAWDGALLNAQKRSVAGFLALQYVGGFPQGLTGHEGTPETQLGLAIKGTGSGHPWSWWRAGLGRAGQSKARLGPVCKCSSSETSTGTAQAENPDIIYLPPERGHPPRARRHRSQVEGTRASGRGSSGQSTVGKSLSLFLHRENGEAVWTGLDKQNVTAYPPGVIEVGPGALTSRDPAAWCCSLTSGHLAGAAPNGTLQVPE